MKHGALTTLICFFIYFCTGSLDAMEYAAAAKPPTLTLNDHSLKSLNSNVMGYLTTFLAPADVKNLALTKKSMQKILENPTTQAHVMCPALYHYLLEKMQLYVKKEESLAITQTILENLNTLYTSILESNSPTNSYGISIKELPTTINNLKANKIETMLDKEKLSTALVNALPIAQRYCTNSFLPALLKGKMYYLLRYHAGTQNRSISWSPPFVNTNYHNSLSQGVMLAYLELSDQHKKIEPLPNTDNNPLIARTNQLLECHTQLRSLFSKPEFEKQLAQKISSYHYEINFACPHTLAYHARQDKAADALAVLTKYGAH